MTEHIRVEPHGRAWYVYLSEDVYSFADKASADRFAARQACLDTEQPPTRLGRYGNNKPPRNQRNGRR